MNHANRTEYTVTLFHCNRLARVIVLWQMQKFMCYCTVFALFYFEFEGYFRLQAGAFIWRGDLFRLVFRLAKLAFLLGIVLALRKANFVSRNIGL